MTQAVITIFENSGENLLTKRIFADDNGKPISDGSACVMGAGTAKTLELKDGLATLAPIISNMPSHRAIALGTITGRPKEVQTVVTAASDPALPGTIARTLNHLTFEEGVPAVMLIDIDMKQMPDDIREVFDKVGPWGMLCEVCTDLKGVGHVTRSSTSSGLKNTETGEDFSGSGGLHIYVMVADGSDIKRALGVLQDRLWLKGWGWIMLGKAGSKLVRSIVDTSVGSPERLVFEGHPKVEGPLVQDKAMREAKHIDGGVLDTRTTLSDLGEGEQARIYTILSNAKIKSEPEAAPLRKAADRKLAKRIAERTGTSEEAALAHLRQRHNGILTTEIELFLDDGTVTTVGEILDNPDRYIGVTMADPLEGPDYGHSKAKVVAADGDGVLLINSFAHGGALYRCCLDYDRVASIIRDLSANTVLENFLAARWRASLSGAALAQLKDLIHKTYNIGKRVIDEAIKSDEARRRGERDRIRQAQQEVDVRTRVLIPKKGAELTPDLRRVDSVLSQVDAPEPPMRNLSGQYAVIKKTGVPGHRLQTRTEIATQGNKEVEKILSIVAPDATGVAVDTERFVQWIEVTGSEEETGQPATRLTHMPFDFASMYSNWNDSASPEVQGISELPLVGLEGRLIAPDGLHRGLRTVFRIPKAILKVLPRTRTSVEQGREAYDWIAKNMLIDVTTGPKGIATIIAAMLTIIERHLIGERPAFVIRAPQRGGGKTTLAIAIALAVTGLRPPAASWGKDEEERRKAIFSYLLTGTAVIIWDNIDRGTKISCSHAAKALTSASVADRVLKESRVENVFATTIQFWTGNSIGLTGDLSSRGLYIDLSVDRPDPENRAFHHSDLFGWIEQKRVAILRALYTILMVETPNVKAKTRFKDWWRLVGHKVEIASGGAIDFRFAFLENEDENEERLGLAHVIEMLKNEYGHIGGTNGRSAQVVSFAPRTLSQWIEIKLASNYGDLKDEGEMLIDALEEAAGGKRFQAGIAPGAVALGHKFRSIVDIPVLINGKVYFLRVHETSRRNGTKYLVEEIPDE